MYTLLVIDFGFLFFGDLQEVYRELSGSATAGYGSDGEVNTIHMEVLKMVLSSGLEITCDTSYCTFDALLK